ncbi:hypothetical protein T08_9709 [Trichinella sp. T8]|nr:hypothetical protein T08_9709 [Trichinella sp. T8]
MDMLGRVFHQRLNKPRFRIVKDHIMDNFQLEQQFC